MAFNPLALLIVCNAVLRGRERAIPEPAFAPFRLHGLLLTERQRLRRWMDDHPELRAVSAR